MKSSVHGVLAHVLNTRFTGPLRVNSKHNLQAVTALHPIVEVPVDTPMLPLLHSGRGPFT
jgi:hypothetical protein